MAPPAAPPPTATARRDLLALAALGLLTFAAARRFDLFDRLVEAGQRLEGAGGDALIVTVLVLAFGLKVYAWRRWREARRELAARLRAEEALRASEARLRLLTRQLPAFLWRTDADLRLDSFAGGFRRDDIDPRPRVGKTVAHLPQLALDLAVAPGAVLAGEAHDQLDGGSRRGRATALRRGAVRPFPLHDLPVLAQHGRGLHEHQGGGEVAAPGSERRQRDLLPAREARRGRHLAQSDPQLLPEYDDLERLVLFAAGEGLDEVEEERQDEEENAEGH